MLPRSASLAALFLLAPALGCQAFKEGMAQSKTAQQLVAACKGEGVEGAAEYVAGTGKATIAAARRRDEDGYEVAGRVLTMDTPQPTSVAEAQLVLCIDAAENVELGACVYDTVNKVAFVEVPGTRQEGPTYTRTRSDQVVRVVEAATGNLVGTDTLTGPEPPACDADLIGGPDQAYFSGNPVGDYTIGQWAKAFVEEH
jgi:hypothetical protein